MTNYLVLDVETSIKNRGEKAIGKDKASPFCPDNQVVLVGERTAVGEVGISRPPSYPKRLSGKIGPLYSRGRNRHRLWVVKRKSFLWRDEIIPKRQKVRVILYRVFAGDNGG